MFKFFLQYVLVYAWCSLCDCLLSVNRSPAKSSGPVAKGMSLSKTKKSDVFFEQMKQEEQVCVLCIVDLKNSMARRSLCVCSCCYTGESMFLITINRMFVRLFIKSLLALIIVVIVCVGYCLRLIPFVFIWFVTC